MGIKTERGKSFNTARVLGYGGCDDGKRCGSAFSNKNPKIRYNSFFGNGGQQKVLRARNNVDPNRRQPKYNITNQNS